MAKIWAVIKYGIVAIIGFLLAVLVFRKNRTARFNIIDDVLRAKEKMREKLNKKSDADIVSDLPNADDIKDILSRGPTDSPSGSSEKDDGTAIWGDGSIFHGE